MSDYDEKKEDSTYREDAVERGSSGEVDLNANVSARSVLPYHTKLKQIKTYLHRD
jgi:hypothetical protein